MSLFDATRRRPGATLVEGAIVLMVTLVILFGLVVGGLGIVRYQMVAELAREATRAASVRGGQYRQDHGLSVGTTTDWSADIYSNGQARWPSLTSTVNVTNFGLDPGNLTYTPTWSTGYNNQPDNYPYYVDANGTPHQNTVTVKVTYNWTPEVGLFPAITFSSTSQMPITN